MSLSDLQHVSGHGCPGSFLTAFDPAHPPSYALHTGHDRSISVLCCPGLAGPDADSSRGSEKVSFPITKSESTKGALKEEK